MITTNNGHDAIVHHSVVLNIFLKTRSVSPLLVVRIARNDASDKQRRNEACVEKHVDNYGVTATSSDVGCTEKDIGDTIVRDEPANEDNRRHEQTVLTEIQDVKGHNQVTRRKLKFAPLWAIQKGIKREYDNNWSRAFQEVPESKIPQGSNVMCAHIVYKISSTENGTLKLKARICPQGNSDKMREDVRNNATTAQFNVIRLMLSIDTCMGAKLGLLNISGAYMKSGPNMRTIYVRPPREWDGGTRGSLWRPLKMPYGITEAGPASVMPYGIVTRVEEGLWPRVTISQWYPYPLIQLNC